jgi:aspartate dehydrogenase
VQKIRFAIAGCGFLGNIVADAWRQGLLADYELVGCLGRNAESVATLAAKNHCQPCSNLEELLALRPDYVVEAASPGLLREIAEPTLSAGASLVVLSIGAFADADFLARVQTLARDRGRRVHLASGAIGGFDVLRTAALMSGIEASIRTEKGPASLRGTPIFSDDLLTAEKPSEVFAGNASDAIALFPTKVNVAVAAALATAGVAATRVSINSVPGFEGDDHRIEVRGEEVHAVVDIYSRTSAIAAWSVVALLRNLAAPIAFG